MTGSNLFNYGQYYKGIMSDVGLMSKRKGTVSKQIVLTQSHLTS